MSSSLSKTTYIEGVGRRKTAVARVRIFSAAKKDSDCEAYLSSKDLFEVNEKSLGEYFSLVRDAKAACSPLEKVSVLGSIRVTVKVEGGGLAAQAEAIRHGLSRALEVHNPEFRPLLKKAGYLTRDPRMVERKKYGLKKARRAPQWSKR